MKKDVPSQYSHLLEQLGLNTEQANTYITLVYNGALPASTIARKIAVSRTLVYYVLEQLEEIGLVHREDKKGEISRFYPTHPSNLEKLLSEKKQGVEIAERSLHTALDPLTTAFNIVVGQPGVSFLEGARGFRHLYKEISKTETDEVRLIRAVRDIENTAMQNVVKQMVERQAERNMTTYAITPTPVYREMTYKSTRDTLATDIKNKIERRYISKEHFSPDAQILLYGEKVAITTFREPVLTTIIEHPDISQTMHLIFKQLWQRADYEHWNILKNVGIRKEDIDLSDT